MNFRAIRVRLTLWYLVVLAAGLAALGVGSWLAMRATIFDAVDEGLDDRVKGVEKFMNEQIASLSLVEIRDEFREHSVLGPGGDLFQVCNQNAEWLYRSVPLENNKVPIRRPSELGATSLYETLSVQKTPVRFASRRILVRGEPYTVQVATPLPEFLEALERFAWILAVIVPVSLIGAGLGGYWISSRALRPVEEIRSAAQSISIRNLNERLNVPRSGDELQSLSETLNDMLARLADSVQRMSQFTADASHELRAPVALIRTTAELAIQNGRTNEEFQNDMTHVLAEAERTSRLIDSLLLLARADTGEDGMHKELTDFTLTVREAIQLASADAAGKQVGIELTAPTGPLAVLGDSEALRRAAFIVVDNAVKYSPESARVMVTVKEEGKYAFCTVADRGIGISSEDQAHVFDRFWRADRARSRGQGGVGLGLAIAKWIVDRHGGSIRVASEPGKGSEFEIQIPLYEQGRPNRKEDS